jgi:hypothetical protein
MVFSPRALRVVADHLTASPLPSREMADRHAKHIASGSWSAGRPVSEEHRVEA